MFRNFILGSSIIVLGLIVIYYIYSTKTTISKNNIFEINIENHVFVPNEIRVKPGVKFKIIVHNMDSTLEEFESHDLHREVPIAPKSKATIIISPLEPGTYEFFGEFNQETAQGKIIVE